jgi:hypothetical protein
MDYTIELWTVGENHFAKCTCKWVAASTDKNMLQDMAVKHKKEHRANGNSVEII